MVLPLLGTELEALATAERSATPECPGVTHASVNILFSCHNTQENPCCGVFYQTFFSNFWYMENVCKINKNRAAQALHVSSIRLWFIGKYRIIVGMKILGFVCYAHLQEPTLSYVARTWHSWMKGCEQSKIEISHFQSHSESSMKHSIRL